MRKNNPLIIPMDIYNDMIKLGRMSLPYEVCGLLTGFRSTIYTNWPLVNEAKSVHRFFVSQSVVEQTLKRIEEKSEEVLAVYHSHPTTSPIPSSYDIEHHDNEVKMIIISYKNNPPAVKCFQIFNHTYYSYPLEIH
ncbi:Mov34/MPN/PAD-1 family protein [Halobacillus sp. A5]|uniref:Mov34/MPN/PAD-1 family protein n=1 Tax=Halobacillus sp. A5 TaxID=2880263 RepID=UPI0020A61E7E|nr:M67 family metallopeptidase [Halobacillus sp. A5]MCP3029093.1 M67 family metallopeptidase [Halobacillus sp. A5]